MYFVKDLSKSCVTFKARHAKKLKELVQMLTHHPQKKERLQKTDLFERMTILMVHLNAFLLFCKNKCKLPGFVPRSYQLLINIRSSSELVIQHHLFNPTRQD